jgi:Type VI secretion system/phage-baseplate injector OB domain
VIKDSYGNTRFFGVYRGIVTGVNDPLNKNRIRVKVPQILADNETQWAWPIGFVSHIPTVDQGVWVQFEGGDPSYPLWHGSFTDNIYSSTGASSSSTLDGGGA